MCVLIMLLALAYVAGKAGDLHTLILSSGTCRYETLDAYPYSDIWLPI